MIFSFLDDLKTQSNFDYSLDISPYAKMMGFRLLGEDGKLTTLMAYHSDLIGSPFPPALHGGTVASLMEMSALMQLVWAIDHTKIQSIPKVIDTTVDYLRSGQPEDTFAKARIFRQGRRFATLHTQAWQSNVEKPIATAMLHLQLTP